jgi:uncharacterized membrane protein YebE (DUF533 family)
MYRQIMIVLIAIGVIGLAAASYFAYKENKNYQKKEKRKAR